MLGVLQVALPLAQRGVADRVSPVFVPLVFLMAGMTFDSLRPRWLRSGR
ncbi:hypothetical protein OH799_16055 [Nocardia sp. NBC_00881]|nr:hypothetical protein OH799_16055 [Nocardia sp. NBC_00881]